MTLNLPPELLARLRQSLASEEVPEKMLAQLEQSELLSSDSPPRSGMTHQEVAADPAAYRRANRADSMPASVLAGAGRAIELLGRTRHTAAVPVLIRLWSSCPFEEIWKAAGAALLAIGTPEALAALSAHVEEYDPDGRITWFAVRAIFRADPAGAFDRLIGHFDPERLAAPGGTKVPFAVVKALGPIGEQGGELNWADPEAPQWFRGDPRWLDLCVSLRYMKPLREIASHVLDYVDPAELAAAMARVKGQPRRRAGRVERGDLVARYRRGEHVQVWKELRRFKAIDGPLREEALAVAAETMRRVAHCCDLVAERLAAEGWVALFGELRGAPEQHLPELVATLGQAGGSPVPPSLLAFWQEVGAVDFAWDYEQFRPAPSFGLSLDLTAMDPLVIAPASAAIQMWLDERSAGDLDAPSPLCLAPDRWRKDNSGDGDPYVIDLPFRGADPCLDGEPHGLPFIDYLRFALRWGGFPGLEDYAGSAAVQSFVSIMTKDFEPF